MSPRLPKPIPAATREENGQFVVEGLVHGDFEGGPIRFTYRFDLKGEVIKMMAVTA